MERKSFRPTARTTAPGPQGVHARVPAPHVQRAQAVAQGKLSGSTLQQRPVPASHVERAQARPSVGASQSRLPSPPAQAKLAPASPVCQCRSLAPHVQAAVGRAAQACSVKATTARPKEAPPARTLPARPAGGRLPHPPGVLQRSQISFKDEMDRLETAAQQDAADYRQASHITGIRRPSTFCYAVDVRNTKRAASAAAGFGWMQCEIDGIDPSAFTSPSDAFSHLDEGLAGILKESCGERWDAISCAEPKAVNNLLKRYPGTKLQDIAILTVYVSNGSLAAPCGVCGQWVYNNLHSVNRENIMGDVTKSLGARLNPFGGQDQGGIQL